MLENLHSAAAAETVLAVLRLNCLQQRHQLHYANARDFLFNVLLYWGGPLEFIIQD